MDDARRPEAEEKCQADAPVPGFRMTKDGLIFDDPDPDTPPLHVAGPFEVLAETRDDHGDNWGLLLKWTDHDGRPHEWAMPRAMLAGDSNEMRARLLDGGLDVTPGTKQRAMLLHYLTRIRKTARARCVDRAGWHGDIYVAADAVYGAPGEERVLLQSGSPIAMPERRGTFDAWRDEVAVHALGNSRLALALCAAFAGPLLHFLGEESFGFHFSGPSSGGKTTALRVAASAWGTPLASWRTTDNAAESLARAANDGFLALDELSQADPRAADAMAYLLGNGQGKGRMRRDVTARPIATWRLVFLSSGETGLSEKLNEAGRRARAGQAVRLIEIPDDAGSGHRMFENLHEFSSGDKLARHLTAATQRHRGHAAPKFIHRIAINASGLTEDLETAVGKWVAEHLPADADGQVSRVARRFAIVAVAGKIATSIGILPWPSGEAERAAAACFDAWLERRGGTGSAELLAGIAQVRAFITAHGSSRFETISELEPRAVINRAGFRRVDESSQWEYFVLPTAWQLEVCKGHDAKAIARELQRRGWLIGDGAGKMSRSETLPGLGKKRVYVLTADILEGDGA
jgi:putative DNA primase/helicase